MKAFLAGFFLLVLGVTLGETIFARFDLQDISQNATALVSRHAAPDADRLNLLIHDIRLRQHALLSTEARGSEASQASEASLASEASQENQGGLAAAFAGLEDARRSFEKANTNPAIGRLYHSFEDEWNRYLELWDRVGLLLRSDNRGDAAALFESGMSPVFDTAQSVLRQIAQTEHDSLVTTLYKAQDLYRDVLYTFEIGFWIILFLSLAAMVYSMFYIALPLDFIARSLACSPGDGPGGDGQFSQMRGGRVRPISRGPFKALFGKLDAGLPTAAWRSCFREIDEIAVALDGFKAQAEATRRLKIKAEEAREATLFGATRDRFDLIESFRRSTTSSIERIHTAHGSMQEATTVTADFARILKDRVRLARDSLEIVVGNISGVAGVSRDLSSQIAAATNVIERCAHIASRAAAEAKDADIKISCLAETSKQICSITQVIGDIADQTNLLALNAAIEAARAGDAGRGFVVVATEVKELAKQTTKATDEIGAQIETMRGAISESVQAIHRIGGTISSIDELAGAMAAGFIEQRSMTEVMTEKMSVASRLSGELLQHIVDFVHEIVDTSTAADRLLRGIEMLDNEIQAMAGDLAAFIAEVKGGRPSSSIVPFEGNGRSVSRPYALVHQSDGGSGQ